MICCLLLSRFITWPSHSPSFTLIVLLQGWPVSCDYFCSCRIKVKCSKPRDMVKACGMSELETWWRWMVSFKLRPPCPRVNKLAVFVGWEVILILPSRGSEKSLSAGNRIPFAQPCCHFTDWVMTVMPRYFVCRFIWLFAQNKTSCLEIAQPILAL
jgi:hypothetical protein